MQKKFKKKHRLLIILTLLIASAAILAGAVYAWFLSKANIKGVSISSGDANLQISLDNNSWVEEITGPSFDAVYPGWESPVFSFYLKNNSDQNINLQVRPQVILEPNSSQDLAEQLEMAILDDQDQIILDYQNINVWQDNNQILVNLNSGEGQNLKLIFRLLNTDQDQSILQNQIMSFDLNLDGLQVAN